MAAVVKDDYLNVTYCISNFEMRHTIRRARVLPFGDGPDTIFSTSSLAY